MAPTVEVSSSQKILDINFPAIEQMGQMQISDVIEILEIIKTNQNVDDKKLTEFIINLLSNPATPDYTVAVSSNIYSGVCNLWNVLLGHSERNIESSIPKESFPQAESFLYLIHKLLAEKHPQLFIKRKKTGFFERAVNAFREA